MCISYLGQKVTTWVSRDHGNHLGQTQVSTSYYLGQSYYLGRNIIIHPVALVEADNSFRAV